MRTVNWTCVQSNEDGALLRALNDGDQSAFWTLWMKYSERLFAICLREMRGNRVDAEDALQDAMLRAHEKLPRFAAEIRSPASWLVRMTSNVCRDAYRNSARSTITIEHLRVLERDRLQLPETDHFSDDFDLTALVALLPHRLREVFVMRIVQRVPYRDIASQLGLTAATARKRVQLSRAYLRARRDDPTQHEAQLR